MMRKNNFILIGFLICMLSCTVESPLSLKPDLVDKNPENMNLLNIANISTEKLKYTSDLTNILETTPNFKNSEINRHNKLIKFFISDYIYAIQEHNNKGKINAFNHFQKSYKKLQKLKTSLPTEDLEYFNRYMVKIKTNMTMLQSLEETTN